MSDEDHEDLLISPGRMPSAVAPTSKRYTPSMAATLDGERNIGERAKWLRGRVRQDEESFWVCAECSFSLLGDRASWVGIEGPTGESPLLRSNRFRHTSSRTSLARSSLAFGCSSKDENPAIGEKTWQKTRGGFKRSTSRWIYASSRNHVADCHMPRNPEIYARAFVRERQSSSLGASEGMRSSSEGFCINATPSSALKLSLPSTATDEFPFTNFDRLGERFVSNFGYH